MTYTKKLKHKFKLFLRKIGMLCKKPKSPKKGVHLSKTIMPSGDEIIHGGFVDKAPINDQSFESELHLYHEMKRDTEKKYNKSSKTNK